jgi:hypothetical protein
MMDGDRMDTEYLASEELERIVFDESLPLGRRIVALDAPLLKGRVSEIVPQDLFDGTQLAIN